MSSGSTSNPIGRRSTGCWAISIGCEVAGLTTDEKVPFVLRHHRRREGATRFAASLVEIDRTISSWPQLASDVALGAAVAVTSARDILLGRSSRSGRSRVDLDELVPTDCKTAARSDRPAVSTVGLERWGPGGDSNPTPVPKGFESAIVEAAGLAPSGGNMQPWRFELNEDRFVVRSFGEQVGMDIGGRGTAVACGAALFNAICVAAAHHRLGSEFGEPDLAIDLDDPSVLAVLPLGRRATESWPSSSGSSPAGPPIDSSIRPPPRCPCGGAGAARAAESAGGMAR